MFARFSCILAILMIAMGRLEADGPEANDFKNADFAAGLSGWSFDGGNQLVFLGHHDLEVKKGDPDAYPAVKMTSSSSRAVVMFQDFTIPAGSSSVTLQIDVFPSKDFKRVNTQDTKMGWEIGVEMQVGDGGPFDADFWVRGGGNMLKLISLQPGEWNHVEAHFRLRNPTTGPGLYHAEFNVAPGTGSVYLVTPVASPK